MISSEHFGRESKFPMAGAKTVSFVNSTPITGPMFDQTHSAANTDTHFVVLPKRGACRRSYMSPCTFILAGARTSRTDNRGTGCPQTSTNFVALMPPCTYPASAERFPQPPPWGMSFA
eukprot:CAMPEP_0118945756 /NCGR_PEP_ID=MMETSP1169-20130426/42891_1 /TAXON_ID=36882 /ORGANISM="Pyramimonas obovata, Strain CCMP722" /LENGTH=117 /DNA_ID=CAMNT_0006891541 /DNA_START=238 /DNA_END=588 /DNA_ORIENTATION=-